MRAVAAAVEITSVPTNRRHHFSIMRRRMRMMKLYEAVEKTEDDNLQSPNERIPLLFNDAQKRFLLKIRRE